MKLKYKYYSQEVAGTYYVMCADKNAHEEIHQFNEVGMDIFRLLENERSEEEIVTELAGIYDISKEVIREDVKLFIEQMVEKGVLE